MATGMPIGFAIGIAAWGYVLIAGVPQLVLAQQIANGPDSWILLAMPLFVLAGLLMNETSISMIIYGAITGVSVSAMFVAGILPGILMGLSQMVIIYFLARKHGWGGISSFSVKEIGVTARAAALGLMMPIIIMGGILGGVF